MEFVSFIHTIACCRATNIDCGDGGGVFAGVQFICAFCSTSYVTHHFLQGVSALLMEGDTRSFAAAFRLFVGIRKLIPDNSISASDINLGAQGARHLFCVNCQNTQSLQLHHTLFCVLFFVSLVVTTISIVTLTTSSFAYLPIIIVIIMSFSRRRHRLLQQHFHNRSHQRFPYFCCHRRSSARSSTAQCI
jgi:hypothetical protein